MGGVVAVLLGGAVEANTATSRARAGTAQASTGATWRFDTSLPGADAHGEALVARMRSTRDEQDATYRPRTRHLDPDGSPRFTNRLFLETSPYLLQHAHNPVNWFAWSDEAFDLAKRLGRPVLLSVGYATCHWCHVMEEESFEDLEIARYLNEHFIAIKVDREERPDIDAIYMAAVQMLTGGGGWPMNVWLTPDRQPFFGGTYFPPRDGDRGVRFGFLSILQRLNAAFTTRRDDVLEASSRLTAEIRKALTHTSTAESLPGRQVIDEAIRYYEAQFDPEYGGIRGTQKFPSGLPVRFLLRHHRRTGRQSSLDMAAETLRHMAAGGIYDQVGGGLHRYATDARWLVPHFEKMLYDNALAVTAYLEVYQATSDAAFADVARDILRYLKRDMQSSEGAFYSATDADSVTPAGEAEEGWFFTWTADELLAVLGEDRARIVQAYYGVTPGGNFEGRNILHVDRTIAEVADEVGVPPARVRAVVDESRDLLYTARLTRPAPLRDEKILTSWNALTISAFAQAALVLGEPAYAATAVRAADFILETLRVDGRVRRSFNAGAARHAGYLDDHAFLTAALLDLYEATSEVRWLREAIAIDRLVERHFEDVERGGFFMTADDAETLLAREKPATDGAEPSGSSVQVMNLLRLHEFTTDDRYRQRTERALLSYADRLSAAPASLAEMLVALDFQLDTPKEIVIVTAGEREQAEPLLARLRGTFVPNRIVAVVRDGDQAQVALVPLVDGKTARDGMPTAYVCTQGVCKLPTTDPDVFSEQIGVVEPLPPLARP